MLADFDQGHLEPEDSVPDFGPANSASGYSPQAHLRQEGFVLDLGAPDKFEEQQRNSEVQDFEQAPGSVLLQDLVPVVNSGLVLGIR